MGADPAYHAAYQGARGAFSEAAARALLGPSVDLLPCRTLVDVFDALTRGDVQMAVVPVTNSIVGAIPDIAELMAFHQAVIHDEYVQPIDQTVIGPSGATMASVRRVWSHPVALAQCARWFVRHPLVEAHTAFDTAGAVSAVVANGDCGDAAIASRAAAEVYGGVVLAERVQDQPDNFTRFVLVSLGAGATPDRRGLV